MAHTVKSVENGYAAAFTTIAMAMGLDSLDNTSYAPQMIITYSVGVWYLSTDNGKGHKITAANVKLADAVEEIARERLK